MAHVMSGGDHYSDVILTTSLRIMWACSYLVDAIIYIWIKTSVRNLLKRKMGFRRNRVRVLRGWEGCSLATSVSRIGAVNWGNFESTG